MFVQASKSVSKYTNVHAVNKFVNEINGSSGSGGGGRDKSGASGSGRRYKGVNTDGIGLKQIRQLKQMFEGGKRHKHSTNNPISKHLKK